MIMDIMAMNKRYLITSPVSVAFPYHRRSAVARVSRAASTCDPHQRETGLLSQPHEVGPHPLLGHATSPNSIALPNQ